MSPTSSRLKELAEESSQLPSHWFLVELFLLTVKMSVICSSERQLSLDGPESVLSQKKTFLFIAALS
jgi:hypothetical protein